MPEPKIILHLGFCHTLPPLLAHIKCLKSKQPRYPEFWEGFGGKEVREPCGNTKIFYCSSCSGATQSIEIGIARPKYLDDPIVFKVLDLTNKKDMAALEEFIKKVGYRASQTLMDLSQIVNDCVARQGGDRYGYNARICSVLAYVL